MNTEKLQRFEAFAWNEYQIFDQLAYRNQENEVFKDKKQAQEHIWDIFFEECVQQGLAGWALRL